MSTIISFHEQATKLCIAAGQHLGETLASQIMGKVILHELSEDDMGQLIEEAMSNARQAFIDGGACEGDVEAICQTIQSSLA